MESNSDYRQQQQQYYPPSGPQQQQQHLGTWQQQQQHPSYQQQQQQQQQQLPPPPPPQQQQQQPPPTTGRRTTRERKAAQQAYQNISPAAVKREAQQAQTMSSSSTRGESKEAGHHEDPMPSTSDFVKKLYKMLEDPTFQSVVSWGPQGDCFVVKDMNEFTKSILPRMFKHSNFASFVRQLNKYDFHKVKNTDDNQFGEHSWTFRHPDFHADRRDALENIKRKVPAQRKNTVLSSSTLPSSSSLPASQSLSASGLPYPQSPGSSSAVGISTQLALDLQTQASNLQHEVRRLRDDNEDLKGRLRSLERSYESVLVEMVGFQRGMAQQDGVMQNLIQYFLSGQGSASGASSGAGGVQQGGGGAGEGGEGRASLSALAHLSQLSSSLNSASSLESQLIQRGYDPAALGVGSSTLSSSSVIAGLGSGSASAGSGGNSSLASILGASNNSTTQQQQSNLQAMLSATMANSTSGMLGTSNPGSYGASGSSGGSTPSPFGGVEYGERRRESPESSSRRRGYY